MSQYKYLFSILLLFFFMGAGEVQSQNANPEVWQNPGVNAINREAMHAHFIPYKSEKYALAQYNKPVWEIFALDEQKERRISLDGIWNFALYKNPSECDDNRILASDADTSGWDKINVPGS